MTTRVVAFGPLVDLSRNSAGIRDATRGAGDSGHEGGKSTLPVAAKGFTRPSPWPSPGGRGDISCAKRLHAALTLSLSRRARGHELRQKALTLALSRWERGQCAQRPSPWPSPDGRGDNAIKLAVQEARRGRLLKACLKPPAFHGLGSTRNRPKIGGPPRQEAIDKPDCSEYADRSGKESRPSLRIAAILERPRSVTTGTVVGVAVEPPPRGDSATIAPTQPVI